MADNNGVVLAGDDVGDGFQCSDHPYRANQGGICAFCLQERLGKLVSSKSNPFFPHPTSPLPSSPPDHASMNPALTSSSRSQIPFLSKKKMKGGTLGTTSTSRKVMAASSSNNGGTDQYSSSSSGGTNVLKRSKSVAPRPMADNNVIPAGESPRIKKSFWSFLYHPSPNGTVSSRSSGKRRSTSNATVSEEVEAVEKNVSASGDVSSESPGGSQASSSFGRKVSRSRSVGCGSRSFSGDFLERISFGDCTLRRVESQREAKPKYGGNGYHDEEQQRIKCGGLFGGFGMVISEGGEEFENVGRRMSTSARLTAPHGRHRGWGWASLASPMRAFRPAPATASIGAAPSTTVIATHVGSSNNGSSNKMGSNPTLLSVGS